MQHLKQNSRSRSKTAAPAAAYWSANYHAPDCPNRENTAGMNGADTDLFCACHSFDQPRPLDNGIDIAWPAGWTAEQAARWREWRGIQRLIHGSAR